MVVLTLLTRFELYGMLMILTNNVEVGRPTQYCNPVGRRGATAPHMISKSFTFATWEVVRE